MAATKIYLEVGAKKVFACAVDWPGWARSGRTEEDAIDALATYADRYAPVAAGAGVTWPKTVARDFTVVERVKGTMTTDFGAPGVVPEIDHERLTKPAARKLASLLEASWAVFDEIAAVTPEHLRKGPRGGGRDRDKMIDHVLGAEASYLRTLGVKHKQPALDDAEAIAAMRADALVALTEPVEDTKWPVRYAVRRLAWHVLDHAWEMQDKTPA